MPLAYYLYRLLLVLFLGCVQIYFHGAALRTVTSRPARTAVHVVFALFAIPLVIFFLPRVIIAGFPRWLVVAWVIPFYIWNFTFAVIFLGVAAAAIVRFPVERIRALRHRPAASPAPAVTAVDLRRRKFIRSGATALVGTALAGGTYGSLHRDECETTFVEMPVDQLPSALAGFSIALVSDIHSSVFMTKEQMERTAASVNALNADLIAVTGDFVDSRVDEVYPFAEAFGALKAPHGVYGVLGNHDYYTGDVETVAREVNRCGITLLRNGNVPVTKNGATFLLLGVDDVGNRDRAERFFDAALGPRPGTLPRILLCHRPYFFRSAARRRIDLTLSGHTHGGQIVLVRMGGNVIAPARVASPYVAGPYAIGASRLYVSRGIGTVGVPIRINCPAEITKITLVRGAAS